VPKKGVETVSKLRIVRDAVAEMEFLIGIMFSFR
jgi:hypothetical protein